TRPWDGRFELRLRDPPSEGVVAHERTPVGHDGPIDHGLPEVGVVVVEPLERTRLDTRPHARERREQIVPADLRVVGDVDARRLDLSDRAPRHFVEDLVQISVADLAAVVTMQGTPQLLPVEALTDLWIRTDDRSL